MAKEKIVEQSGVIAYGLNEGNLSLVLITSKSTKRWVVPKGHIEPNLTAKESAEQEAFEEAGIEGVVSDVTVGSYDYTKHDKEDSNIYRVSLFPMEIQRLHNDWPEANLRARQWMTIPQAVNAVNEETLKLLLKNFGEEMVQSRPGVHHGANSFETVATTIVSRIKKWWNAIAYLR